MASPKDEVATLRAELESLPPQTYYRDVGTIPNPRMDDNLYSSSKSGEIGVRAAEITLDAADDVFFSAQQEANRAEQAANAAAGGAATATTEATKSKNEADRSEYWANYVETGADLQNLAHQIAALPKTKPVVLADFVNSGFLDNRFEFTRASVDWDEEGNEYGIDEPVLTDKGLWVSGARTNLLVRSSQPWRTPWSSGGGNYFNIESQEATPIPGAKASFYGPVAGGASLVNPPASQDITLTAGKYTLSGYFKAVNPNGLVSSPTIRSFTRGISGYTGSAGSIVYRLYGDGGFRSSSSATGDGVFGQSKGVECTPVGGGWFRLVETFELLEDASIQIRLFPYDGGSSFTGDGETGLLRSALQLEEGEIATSYIPTEGSQVTVAADNVSIPTSEFPYNSRALSAVFDVQLPESYIAPSRYVFSFEANAGNRISVSTGSMEVGIALGLTIRREYSNHGVWMPGGYAGGNLKIGISVADNSQALLSVNGTVVSMPYGDVLPDVQNLFINWRGVPNNNQFRTANYKSVTYYHHVLTDTELQELTTL